MANLRQELRGVVTGAFSWDSIASDLLRSSAFTGIGWLLVWLGKFDLYRSAPFWVTVFVATFLVLGVVNSLMNPRKSGLSVSVDQVSTGKVEDGTAPIVLVMLAVSNTGTPSVADDWQIALRLPGNIRHELTRLDGTDSRLIDGQTLKISRDQMIFSKTAEPIAQGAKVRGFLVGVGRDLRRDVVDQPGATVVIECTDVAGRHCYGEAPFSPKPFIDLRLYPGIEYTVEPPSSGG